MSRASKLGSPPRAWGQYHCAPIAYLRKHRDVSRASIGSTHRAHRAIAILNKEGETPVPCATLSLLMLGTGISITHQAIKTPAENGCSRFEGKRDRVFEIHMRGGAVRLTLSGMGASPNRMTGGARSRSIELFRRPTVVGTESFMLQLSLRATHLRADSFIPARCSRSSTMSPIVPKRTSPFRQLFAAQQPVRVDERVECGICAVI